MVATTKGPYRDDEGVVAMTDEQRDEASAYRRRRDEALETARRRVEAMPPLRRAALSQEFREADERALYVVRGGRPSLQVDRTA